MSRGKYLSLEEARNNGQIDRFCKEHPAVGDEAKFDALLDAIAKEKSLSDTKAKLSKKGAMPNE